MVHRLNETAGMLSEAGHQVTVNRRKLDYSVAKPPVDMQFFCRIREGCAERLRTPRICHRLTTRNPLLSHAAGLVRMSRQIDVFILNASSYPTCCGCVHRASRECRGGRQWTISGRIFPLHFRITAALLHDAPELGHPSQRRNPEDRERRPLRHQL